MPDCRNPNHPKPGDNIKVEPIRSVDDIHAIQTLILGQKKSARIRDWAIFTIGVNTNLRASDLLKLRIGQVRNARIGEEFLLKEQKTGKNRAVTINRAVHHALQELLATMPDAGDDDFIFQSQKGGGKLTVPYLNFMVKKWAKALRLRGNYGSHTLRKTFGYIHRTVHNTSIPILMVMFNHASQQETLNYLCIQPIEVKDAYMQDVS